MTECRLLYSGSCKLSLVFHCPTLMLPLERPALKRFFNAGRSSPLSVLARSFRASAQASTSQNPLPFDIDKKCSTMYTNNLHVKAQANQLCKAFGIKITSNAQIVQLADNAGFDALWIDCEHGWLTHGETSNLCNVGLLTGITPFVRVPHECGNGFVQRVLDGGAMGIVFPHIHSAGRWSPTHIPPKRCFLLTISGLADARAAVAICKYPPQGIRSMTGQPILFGTRPTPVPEVIEKVNVSGSSVIAMIESRSGVDNAEAIAAVEGVDVLLVGSVDLSIELGVPAQFDSTEWRAALEKVSQACRSSGKIMGVAGVYDNPELQSLLINDLGVRFMLVQQDASLVLGGGTKAVEEIKEVAGEK